MTWSSTNLCATCLSPPLSTQPSDHAPRLLPPSTAAASSCPMCHRTRACLPLPARPLNTSSPGSCQGSVTPPSSLRMTQILLLSNLQRAPSASVLLLMWKMLTLIMSERDEELRSPAPQTFRTPKSQHSLSQSPQLEVARARATKMESAEGVLPVG